MTSSTNLSNFSKPESESAETAHGLSPTEEALLKRLKVEQSRRVAETRLLYYRPYKKQIEFHAAGVAPVRQRLFMAGNQLGKTMAGASEVAMHLTGLYDEASANMPGGWPGHRFDKPIVALAGSESADLTKRGVQRMLVGPPQREEEWGTGSIPKHLIVDWSRKQGVPDALDSITVRHVSGGVSTLLFKSYDQGRAKWQADTVDLVWFDEEPPFDVYDEGCTRTVATRGIILITFTPLLGMSQVVKRFLHEPHPSRAVTVMTIFDVEHLTDEEKQQTIDSYPAHMRDARAMGVPMIGAGAVFPVSDESILVNPFRVPWGWKHICGIDFGWDHPTAAIELAYDPDGDVVYVVREYREKQKTPAEHCLTLKTWEGVRFAWPRDGSNTEKGSGQQLSHQYAKAGLRMLPAHATFEDGSNYVEPGIQMMLSRMQTGRWKVFSTCVKWLEEKRMYHRTPTPDGGSELVKKDEDLIDASRYAFMMLRDARHVERLRPMHLREEPSKIAEGTGQLEGY